MRKTILSALCLLVGSAVAQIRVELLPTSDWVWYAPEQPQLDVLIRDSLGQAVTTDLTLRVTTDTKEPICELSQSVSVAAGDSAVLRFRPGIDRPGFYHVFIEADGRSVVDNVIEQYGRQQHTDFYCIGYEPEHILSLPDGQPDLRAFWDRALQELAATPMEARVSELKEKSTKQKKAYEARVIGLGDDTVRLYYTVPVRKGRYPVHVINMGYGSEPWELGMDDLDWIDVIVSSRGQGANKPNNRYGEWLRHGLASAETYYYRGAYLDCVRAIDYLVTLPQVDTDRIFLEGGSQGAAYSMAAAALDHRIRAIAVYITFMSDFPDYFRIVDWPAEPIMQEADQLGITKQDALRTLSYFDIKNLARWIECPVYLGIGLQDPTCPPHTNFSGYNLVRSPKEYHIYRNYGHHVDYAHWNPALRRWFDTHSKKKL